MKKIALIFFGIILCFSLFACTPVDGGEEESAVSETQTDSKYVFAVASKDNFKVKLDMDMADVLAALGEPLSYFEAASCAFEGLDKTYTYAGFQVLTRPDGDKDYVNSVLLTDDTVSTPEGAYLGMTADEVKAACGTPQTETATLIGYTDANTTMNFVLKDSKVISIEYIPA